MQKSNKSIKDRGGSLKKYTQSKPVSIEEMNKVIIEAAINRFKNR